MNCIFCGSKTGVCDSRVWLTDKLIMRRRKCKSCGVIFQTVEIPMDQYNELASKAEKVNAVLNIDTVIDYLKTLKEN